MTKLKTVWMDTEHVVGILAEADFEACKQRWNLIWVPEHEICRRADDVLWRCCTYNGHAVGEAMGIADALGGIKSWWMPGGDTPQPLALTLVTGQLVIIVAPMECQGHKWTPEETPLLLRRE